MRWKFKIGDIIYDPPFVAKVIGRNHSKYHVLYLDSSFGWHAGGYVEDTYDRIEFNAKFFDLFVKLFAE